MTPEQIALEHGLCTCDPIYTSRGMKAPDCPWHAYEVETAMEAYGKQEAKHEAKEFAEWMAFNHPADLNSGGDVVKLYYANSSITQGAGQYDIHQLYDLYLTHKNKNNGE